MATKKVTTKKSAAKKSPAKKTTTKKNIIKVEKQPANIYNTNVSVLLAMAVEALILLLGYLIIMNAA